MDRTITVVLRDEGRLSIFTGGAIPPLEGADACQAAARWFQQQAIEAEVQRRLEESQKETETTGDEEEESHDEA
jgi:hypothetical protein